MTKLIFTLTTLLISGLSLAKTPMFTTVNASGKDIFAGVKIEQKGVEPETYLLQVSSDLKSSKVSLPMELQHREVIAVFPAEKSSVVVLTQRTVEQGDKPQFHSYNTEKKEWKKLSELDCVSFAKVEVEKNSITLTCTETNEKGEEVKKEKKASFKDVTLTNTGKKTLPISEVKLGDLEAKLSGDAFEWAELKVKKDKTKKSFRP